MKPEILLKAYVLYESEDAFRELVICSLDEVYSTALRIVGGPPHLVEDAVLRVYWELARKASIVSKDAVLAAWLRERTCKMAAVVLREEGRSVDRAALKREKQMLFDPTVVQSAPAGLATRVCQGILLNAACHKGFRLSLRRFQVLSRIRLPHLGAAAIGVLVVIVVWKVPFHRRNPIVMSPALQMTLSSFAQRAVPEDGGGGPEPGHSANTNTQAKPKQP